MRQPHIAPPGADTFLISIDSYEDGKMTGTLDSVIMSAPVRFSSLPSLIMLIDNILDQQTESLQSILSPIDPALSLLLNLRFSSASTTLGKAASNGTQVRNKLPSRAFLNFCSSSRWPSEIKEGGSSWGKQMFISTKLFVQDAGPACMIASSIISFSKMVRRTRLGNV